ncbi:hypothetical protein C8R44DRAFT_747000 [Mycena epipterygia]|nr:hypothetical protein C8R44DRAFT_747000 [Mycena epipterygia]
MEFATPFAAELRLAILSDLYLPDLVSVSAACRSFQIFASPAVQAHKALCARYRRLGYDREYDSQYWYPLLFALLQDPAAAYYVDDLEVDHTERDLAGELEGTDNPWMVPAPADEALIRRAVEEERWIPEEEKTTFVDRILDGDEDAMVTVMVLRMPNLWRLSLPTYCWGRLDFKYLMPIVARIAQAVANPEQDPVDTLPLSKLERYEGQVFNGTYGVDFESIAPLMALPSLRTLSTEWNSEEGFDWPASLPKSNVREIDIKEGTLTSEAILRLAKGIRGPCVIRQEWVRNDTYPELEWHSLEIPFEGAGEGDWVIILESDSDKDGDEV